MKRDDIIGGIVLLGVIVGIGAFFLFAQKAPELAYGPVEIPGSMLAATAVGDGEVEVIATMIQPGFVTVHQSLGGAPGPIIGTSGYIESGTDVPMTLGLSELMDAGTTYIALLHVDNGDKQFVITDDMPVTNGGASVRADFVWTDAAKNER